MIEANVWQFDCSKWARWRLDAAGGRMGADMQQDGADPQNRFEGRRIEWMSGCIVPWFVPWIGKELSLEAVTERVLLSPFKWKKRC